MITIFEAVVRSTTAAHFTTRTPHISRLLSSCLNELITPTGIVIHGDPPRLPDVLISGAGSGVKQANHAKVSFSFSL